VTTIDQLVQRLIALRAGGMHITLLAVCPNSDAVLQAAIQAAGSNNMPLLLAATLNQVDRDGGYTGWTPQGFVARMHELAAEYGRAVPLFPCLDHGGPWLKDLHTRDRWSYEQTMAAVKRSLTACLEAGYALLHVDPTVDRTLPPGQTPTVEVVVSRTVQLISYAESERLRLRLPPVSYEVGTEEVRGGLVKLGEFASFLSGLRVGLDAAGLARAWPCFIVGSVGTDLHTTTFDPQSACRLYEEVAPLGSLIKGHYTDWVANPAAYPAAGMGGANVGPEFTAAELAALYELCAREAWLAEQGLTFPKAASFREGRRVLPSSFRAALKSAVLDSGRWHKWLTPEEAGIDFAQLDPGRQDWLIATGARYVWTKPNVQEARQRLYDNLHEQAFDPHAFVVARIAQTMQKYVKAFNLRNSWPLLLT
jgi:tagatose-1,6-bisphosphate aldolase non-catalytic subunit AgaZ/GatZ